MSPFYRLDLEWFRAINVGWHSPILDPFFAFLSYFGLGEVEFFVVLGLLFFKKAKAYVLPLIVALLLSSPTSQIPKHLIPRDRPSLLTFSMPAEPLKYYAFPSGHTTSAFALAFMMIFLTLGTRRAWMGYASLFVALLIGISRIYRGVHWPSDVLAGFFVGCFTAAIAYLVLQLLGKIPDFEAADQPASETGP